MPDSPSHHPFFVRIVADRRHFRGQLRPLFQVYYETTGRLFASFVKPDSMIDLSENDRPGHPESRRFSVGTDLLFRMKFLQMILSKVFFWTRNCVSESRNLHPIFTSEKLSPKSQTTIMANGMSDDPGQSNRRIKGPVGVRNWLNCS
jgi:hypothetical protein